MKVILYSGRYSGWLMRNSRSMDSVVLSLSLLWTWPQKMSWAHSLVPACWVPGVLPSYPSHCGLCHQHRLLIRQQLDAIWKSKVLHHHRQLPALCVVLQHSENTTTTTNLFLPQGGTCLHNKEALYNFRTFRSASKTGSELQLWVYIEYFQPTVRQPWPPWWGSDTLCAATCCWSQWSTPSSHPVSPPGHWWTTASCQRPPHPPSPTWPLHLQKNKKSTGLWVWTEKHEDQPGKPSLFRSYTKTGH